jgi:nicotinate-nucleotide pyrophosphorylase (carboxylating)
VELRGSIAAAVAKPWGVSGFSQKIEVECRSLDKALEAAGAGADVVMLDNFVPERMRVGEVAGALKRRYPHVTVEASGGITMETITGYFSEYVDVIIQGKLTKGYDCLDFSLKSVHCYSSQKSLYSIAIVIEN